MFLFCCYFRNNPMYLCSHNVWRFFHWCINLEILHLYSRVLIISLSLISFPFLFISNPILRTNFPVLSYIFLKIFLVLLFVDILLLFFALLLQIIFFYFLLGLPIVFAVHWNLLLSLLNPSISLIAFSCCRSSAISNVAVIHLILALSSYKMGSSYLNNKVIHFLLDIFQETCRSYQ